MAGDFFGEMSLIHGEPRTATRRAATPCVLHELKREGFLAESEGLTTVRAELERVERARRAELEVGDGGGSAK
jgi:CRP-like cAMP-binding protein